MDGTMMNYREIRWAGREGSNNINEPKRVLSGLTGENA